MKKILSFFSALCLVGSLSAQITIPQSISARISGVNRVECMDGAVVSHTINTEGFNPAPSISVQGLQLLQAQYVKGISSISAIRFWGAQLTIENEKLAPANDLDPLSFTVKIYANENGLPGEEIYSEDVSLSHEPTDLAANMGGKELRVFQWDFVPEQSISNLPSEVWITIASTDENVFLFWANGIEDETETAVATFAKPQGGGGCILV